MPSTTRAQSGALPGPDAERVAQYVRGRQTPAGGYCYYRAWGVEEPDAADTFYAVAVLAALGEQPGDLPGLLRWLGDQQQHGGAFASIATGWHVTETLRHLGKSPAHEPGPWLRTRSDLLFDTPSPHDEPFPTLLNLARYLELCARFGVLLETRHLEAIRFWLRAFHDPNGVLAHDAPTLAAGAVVLRIAAASARTPDRHLLDFARSCEDPVYGFRNSPNGRSTQLSALAGGCTILRAFRTAARYPGALRRTVIACQTRPGGFGRQPGAVATLQDTWVAIATLTTSDPPFFPPLAALRRTP